MAYLEALPDQCPPATAVDQAFGPAYRILTDPDPVIDHFYSHRAKGLRLPPGLDDCRFASCSLFMSKDKAAAIASKMPKKRAAATHLAEIMVPQGAGASVKNEATLHVDFWMYDDFDVKAAVTNVWAI